MTSTIKLKSTRIPIIQIVPVYRGDFLSITIIMTNSDGTPFDFSVFNSFESKLRVQDPRNTEILYTLLPGDFVLGKTDSGNTEFDELHVTSTLALEFEEFYKTVWMDVQGLIGDEVYTFAKFKLQIEPDVTR